MRHAKVIAAMGLSLTATPPSRSCCHRWPQRDTAFAGGSSRTSRAFSPVVGSPSPYATPKLPETIDFNPKPAAPVVPASRQGLYDPFGAFDPAPCLLAAALGSYGIRLHPQPPLQPFPVAAAPLAPRQVDWSWSPLYARGSSIGGGVQW